MLRFGVIVPKPFFLRVSLELGLGATVRRNEVRVFVVPSLTMNVTVVLPVWPGKGVNVTFRLLPLPPKTIPPFGIKAGLEEVPCSVRLDAGVSLSPMVKVTGGKADPAMAF